MNKGSWWTNTPNSLLLSETILRNILPTLPKVPSKKEPQCPTMVTCSWSDLCCWLPPVPASLPHSPTNAPQGHFQINDCIQPLLQSLSLGNSNLALNHQNSLQFQRQSFTCSKHNRVHNSIKLLYKENRVKEKRG